MSEIFITPDFERKVAGLVQDFAENADNPHVQAVILDQMQAVYENLTGGDVDKSALLRAMGLAPIVFDEPTETPPADEPMVGKEQGGYVNTASMYIIGETPPDDLYNILKSVQMNHDNEANKSAHQVGLGEPHHTLTLADMGTIDGNRHIKLSPPNRGYSWGAPELDEAMGRMQAGQVFMVFGHNKAGKSTFLHNVAFHLMMQGYPIGYFSLEETRYIVRSRIESIAGHLIGWKSFLYLYDRSCWIEEIGNIIESWKRDRTDLRVVLIDYSPLIFNSNNPLHTLKQIAEAYNIVIIIAHQFPRSVSKEQMTIADVDNIVQFTGNHSIDGVFAIRPNVAKLNYFEIVTLGRRGYPSGGVVRMVQNRFTMTPVSDDEYPTGDFDPLATNF